MLKLMPFCKTPPPFILAPPDYQFSVMTQVKKKFKNDVEILKKFLKLLQEEISDAKYCMSFLNSMKTTEKKF